MVKIAVDAMGGDFAPEVNIYGALEATESEDIEVILVGDEPRIKDFLKQKGYFKSSLSVVHAEDFISMDEPVATAIRKRNSSMRKAIELVKGGKAQAVISAGHSGAMMALSFLILGKIPNVDRPAIATVMPSLKGHFILLDAGANVDCKAEHLYQFALMGNAYHKALFNSQSPKVALLSIGEEDIKGNEVTREAFKLLQSEKTINFIGNIEGKDLFFGSADVVVCDGFVGNIVLKVGEGLADALIKMLKLEIANVITGKIGYLMIKPAVKNFKKRIDYSEYGGALLLGINGTSVICHGRSSSKAIKNAIKLAADMAKKEVYKRVIQSLISKEEFNESQDTVNRFLCT